jgi:hypothetical protein
VAKNDGRPTSWWWSAPRDELEIDGQVDEEALPDGAFIGEIEPFPRDVRTGTFELTAVTTPSSATS